jgi:hypothetical protein
MTLTHCIAGDCGKQFDSSIPETREGLRSFWQRYCPQCRTKGNAGTQPTLTHKFKRHFIAMSGSHGCIPDYCDVFPEYQAAVDSLADMFELGRTRKARLLADRTLELSSEDGAEYCEIQTCDCDNPGTHSDNGVDLDDYLVR